MLEAGSGMAIVYDRWRCREFVHRALQLLGETQLPLFWYCLAFNSTATLALLDESSQGVQRLRDEWQEMSQWERQDTLNHFAFVLRRIAEAAAVRTPPMLDPLPGKE